MTESLGQRLARALADKDEAALRGVLADDVDFRGLTPGRSWEASSPDEVGDTARVGYRFDVDNPDGQHVVEQQVYYRGDSGRITYARVVCSGFRPR